MNPENTTIAQILRAKEALEKEAAELINSFGEKTKCAIDQITPFTDFINDRLACTSIAVNANPLCEIYWSEQPLKKDISVFKECKWQLEASMCGVIQAFEIRHGVTVEKIHVYHEFDEDLEPAPDSPGIAITLCIDSMLALNLG